MFWRTRDGGDGRERPENVLFGKLYASSPREAGAGLKEQVGILEVDVDPNEFAYHTVYPEMRQTLVGSGRDENCLGRDSFRILFVSSVHHRPDSCLSFVNDTIVLFTCRLLLDWEGVLIDERGTDLGSWTTRR